MIQLIGGVIHISSCIFQLDLVHITQTLFFDTNFIDPFFRTGFETPRHTYAIGCDLRYMEFYQYIHLLFLW